MDQLASTDATGWNESLLLEERVGLLEQAQHNDAQLSVIRQQRWRTQAPFGDHAKLLTRRLAHANLDDATFAALLGLDPASAETAPDWVAPLIAAYDSPPTPSLAMQRLPLPDFLLPLRPLISPTVARFEQTVVLCLNKSPISIANETHVIDHFVAALLKSLLQFSERVLTLELQIARWEERLEGESATERYRNFIRHYHHREHAVALLQQYPNLGRLTLEHLAQWEQVSTEFIERFVTDWPQLNAVFGGDDILGRLIDIQIDAGDTHRNGHTTMICRFEGDQKIVYKPRPCAIDRHFQTLLKWLNARGKHPALRCLQIVDRETYGWVEFIAHRYCTSAEQFARFYQRQGAYLALFYVLQTTDLHFENMIAHGEHPVPIDLEGMFAHEWAQRGPGTANANARFELTYSVLRTGILPRKVKAEADSADLSVLFGRAYHQKSGSRYRWVDVGLETMRLETVEGFKRAGSQNLPTAAEFDLTDYTADITAGFTQMYHLLWRERDALLAADGPLRPFKQCHVRYFARPSMIYWTLLLDSYHPDKLRSGLERSRLFDKLWNGVEVLPQLERLIEAERRDLLRNDIPLFSSCPGERHLWDSDGVCIPNMLPDCTYDMVTQRLNRLDSADLQRQLWITRAALYSTTLHVSDARKRSYVPFDYDHPVTQQQLLDHALSIGRGLADRAFVTDTEATWMTISEVGEFEPLQLDLYRGLPGVTLFMAYLATISGDADLAQLARRCANTLVAQIAQPPEDLTLIGGFSGWGGLVYTLAHVGALWNESDWLDAAEQCLLPIAQRLTQDDVYDIVGGAAGAILGLAALERVRPRQATRELIKRCATHLFHHCPEVQAADEATQSGWAHGAAGIAVALLTASHLLKLEPLQSAAERTLARERQLWMPEHGNWLDRRRAEHPIPYMMAWCSGAPGIGLGRIAALPYLPNDPQLQVEIDAALTTTLAQGFGGTHSLCHGDFGNLDLLVSAHQQTDRDLSTVIGRKTAMILESQRRYGMICGMPIDLELPGLMTGVTGMAWGCLRIAFPDRIPSLLTMAPPSI